MTGCGETSAGGPARHIPVLLDEVLEMLNPVSGGLYVDGTFGAGGYSRAILDRADCSVIGFDRDETAIEAGAALVAAYGGRLELKHERFSQMDEILRNAGIRHVDGVVLDIGVSSMQLDDRARGFSFMGDGPLDMRMGRSGLSAADLVNRAEENDLARIIAVYGEERKARRVARAIVRAREDQPILRTGALARIIEKALGVPPGQRIHPATRTFQGLRIFVNQELEELAEGLAAAERLLKPGGRLVVVSFHSLEDRIVKRFFNARSRPAPRPSRHAPVVETGEQLSFRPLHKGAVSPGEGELAANPRARSARLRAGERTEVPAMAFDAVAMGVPKLNLHLGGLQ